MIPSPETQQETTRGKHCTSCTKVIDHDAATKEKIEKLAARFPGGEYKWPVCNSCINLIRGNQKPRWSGPISGLRNMALNAIAKDRYEEYASLDRQLKYHYARLDGDMGDLVEQLRSLNGRKVEIENIERQLANALAASPRASYFIRRIEANKAISNHEIRILVFKRDNYRCVKCQCTQQLSIDHIKPVVAGGGDEPDNLQTLCRSCNSSKGGRWTEEPATTTLP